MLYVILTICFLSFFLVLKKEEKIKMVDWIKFLMKRKKAIKNNYHELFYLLMKTNSSYEERFLLFKSLPHFSFYKDAIGNFIVLSQKYGVIPKTWAKNLRKSFFQHFKFNEKFKRKILEIIFQTLFIYSICYLFIFALKYIVLEVEISFIPIILWQSFGLIIFFVLYTYFYKKYFDGFKETLFSLTTFSTLVTLSLSQQKILELIKLGQLKKNSRFKTLNEWFINLIQDWLRKGSEVTKEIEHIQDEAWWQFEEAFVRFSEALNAIRLVMLFIFGLPSYFYVIYKIGESFA